MFQSIKALPELDSSNSAVAIDNITIQHEGLLLETGVGESTES